MTFCVGVNGLAEFGSVAGVQNGVEVAATWPGNTCQDPPQTKSTLIIRWRSRRSDKKGIHGSQRCYRFNMAMSFAMTSRRPDAVSCMVSAGVRIACVARCPGVLGFLSSTPDQGFRLLSPRLHVELLAMNPSHHPHTYTCTLIVMVCSTTAWQMEMRRRLLILAAGEKRASFTSSGYMYSRSLQKWQARPQHAPDVGEHCNVGIFDGA